MATRIREKAKVRKETADKRPRATARYVRISSRKVKIVIDLIRGKKVMLGAIDVANETIETPEEVAATLRKALNFADADKLIPSTNCGMAPFARDVSLAKMSALSAGTAIVREELSRG